MTPADLHAPEELEALEAENRPGWAIGAALALGLTLTLACAAALGLAGCCGLYLGVKALLAAW